MSVTVLSRVLWTEFTELSYMQKSRVVTVSEPVAKLVMIAIADNADDFGENSWQSFETISKKASVERRSAIRAIRALMDAGYLSIDGKSRYGTNDYKIHLSKLGFAPVARDKVGRPKTSDSTVTNIKETSDSEAKTSDTGSPYPSFNRPLTTTTGDGKNADEPAEDPQAKSSRVFKHFQDNICMLTPVLAEQIGEAIETYQEIWIIDAINEAVTSGVRNWKYINAILTRWGVQGRDAKKKDTENATNNRTNRYSGKKQSTPKQTVIYSAADLAAAEAINNM